MPESSQSVEVDYYSEVQTPQADQVFVDLVKRVSPKDTFRFLSLDEIQDIRQKVYYYPSSKTEQYLDSFIVVDETMLIFQVMIAANHDLKGPDLINLINTIDRCSGRASFEYHLIFVCPNGAKNTKDFKRQLITKVPKESVALITNSKLVTNQWILELGSGQDPSIFEFVKAASRMK